MIRKLPAELGELVESHRPMSRWAGWGAIAVFPAIFGIMAAVMPPGPLIGLIVFVGFLIPIMYATAEWFLLEHRIYRNGIVFGSDLPGMKTYVVPYYTCGTGSLGVVGRRVHDGTDLSEAVDRRFRQCPITAHNVSLTGLDPSIAMKIGAGKAPFTAGTSITRLGEKTIVTPQKRQTWLFSSRTPEHHIDLLRDLITSSNATHPEWAGKQRPTKPASPC